jgi:hypothetical protein
MTDFEATVLRELGEIKAAVATNAEKQNGHEFRLATLENYNTVQDNRAWVKSILGAAIVVVAHPIARKLGWDI